MSWMLLLMALFTAWLAWNLYLPVLVHKHGHVVSFVFGWLVGELAPFVVAVGVLLLIIRLAGYDLQGFVDRMSLIVLLTSWGAMLRFYLHGGDAADAMDGQLRATLGDNYLESIEPSMLAAFPISVSMRRLLRPFSLDVAQVTRVRDITFAEEHGAAIKLDVYHRRDRPGNCPVLMQIHGGGWTEKMGSKNEQARPLMNHMAERGWVCVSVDYRLSPTFAFPAHIIDCKKGLAWIKQNIAAYGGNPDFVVVTGGSAGGHLSSLLALSANDPQYQPGFEQVDTRVQGCVPFYGVYDFTDHLGLKPNRVLLDALESSIVQVPFDKAAEFYRQASPIHRVHADAPPFLVIHGENDSLTPAAEAQKFSDLLAAASKEPVIYAEVAGAQHAFDIFRSLRSELVMFGVERFLVWLYSRHLRASRAAG